jgi:hypothetical protein
MVAIEWNGEMLVAGGEGVVRVSIEDGNLTWELCETLPPNLLPGTLIKLWATDPRTGQSALVSSE